MNVPKDQIWAWWSVLGGFISCSLTISIDLSYSIVFKDVKTFYNVNSTTASSLFGFIVGFRFLLSPIAVVGIKYYGCDKVSIFGGILVGIGLFVSSFAPNMWIFIASYGVLVGIGLSFGYTSLLIILSENFNKKKSLAFGIATSGVSLAYVAFPHIFALVIVQFEFRSALMLLSAFSLNMIVAGLLYRRPYNVKYLNKEIEIKVLLIKKESNNNIPNEFKESIKIYQETRNNVKPYRNWDFWWFSIGVSWFLIGMVPWSIFIVDFINSIDGMKLNVAVLTFTLEGIAQFIARILSGVILDKSFVRMYRGIICAVGCGLSGWICILLVTINSSIYSYLCLSVFRGLSLGVFISQNVVILGDLCSSSHLSVAIGIITFLKGIGCILGSILSGLIRDNFPSYLETFIFLAVNQFGAAALILFPFVKNIVRIRKL